MAAPINRRVFFDAVRHDPFEGALTPGQVDGLIRILDYRDGAWPAMPDNELAYVLATTKWETGHSMQPVAEGYPKTGARLRAFQRGLRYAPYWGRGLVQITHDYNYEKFGIKARPDEALKWPKALDILFRGMIFGMFTGKKLADYFSDQQSDWHNARRIVNGTDQADRIAEIAQGFFSALSAARAAPPEPVDVPPTPSPEAIPEATSPSAPLAHPGLVLAAGAALLGWLILIAMLLTIHADLRQLTAAHPRPTVTRPK